MNSTISDNFVYNTLLVQSLLRRHYPSDERKLLWKWVNKLKSIDGTRVEKAVRNDYMWFLLLILQNDYITYPFDQNPPKKLSPLITILPQETYKQVICPSNENLKIDNKMSETTTKPLRLNSLELIPTSSSLFLLKQYQCHHAHEKKYLHDISNLINKNTDFNNFED